MKQHLIIFVTLCSIPAFLNASEQKVVQKPIIEAIIQPLHTILYSISSYEKEILIPAGLGSIHDSIPLIKVSVVLKENDMYQNFTNEWTRREPEAIRLYEKKTQSDRNFRTDRRIFPEFIPLPLLLDAKEGDVLSLTVHGYQTQLICSAVHIGTLHHYDKQHALQVLSQENKLNFEQCLNYSLTKCTHKYMVYKNSQTHRQEIIEKELLMRKYDRLLNYGKSACTREAIIKKLRLMALLQEPFIKTVMLLWLFRHETG
jgi:uncharacterized protein with PIN domain